MCDYVMYIGFKKIVKILCWNGYLVQFNLDYNFETILVFGTTLEKFTIDACRTFHWMFLLAISMHHKI